jgi:hypothetical protein
MASTQHIWPRLSINMHRFYYNLLGHWNKSLNCRIIMKLRTDLTHFRKSFDKYEIKGNILGGDFNVPYVFRTKILKTLNNSCSNRGIFNSIQKIILINESDYSNLFIQRSKSKN